MVLTGALLNALQNPLTSLGTITVTLLIKDFSATSTKLTNESNLSTTEYKHHASVKLNSWQILQQNVAHSSQTTFDLTSNVSHQQLLLYLQTLTRRFGHYELLLLRGSNHLLIKTIWFYNAAKDVHSLDAYVLLSCIVCLL